MSPEPEHQPRIDWESICRELMPENNCDNLQEEAVSEIVQKALTSLDGAEVVALFSVSGLQENMLASPSPDLVVYGHYLSKIAILAAEANPEIFEVSDRATKKKLLNLKMVFPNADVFSKRVSSVGGGLSSADTFEDFCGRKFTAGLAKKLSAIQKSL